MTPARCLKKILIQTSLWGFLALWILPLFVLAMSAIRPVREIRRGWWSFENATFSFGNFVEAWNAGIADYFLNTTKIAILATLLPLFVGSLAAFVITKYQQRSKTAVYALYLSTMLLPAQLILIPLFPWLIALNLNDSLLGLVLVHGAFGMGWTVFHLVNFFRDIPNELIESAQMDGANPARIFFQVVLPLARPAIISYCVLQFIWVWNDLLLALVLIQSPDKYPMTVGLVNLQSPRYPQWDLLAAGSLLAILPPILLFFILQRFYGNEMFKGAVK